MGRYLDLARHTVKCLGGKPPTADLPAVPSVAEEERLGGLFRRGSVHRCRSRLLGEDVLFTADGAQIPPGNTLTVYRESELRQMAGQPPALVRAIHLAKQALDGEVIEEE